MAYSAAPLPPLTDAETGDEHKSNLTTADEDDFFGNPPADEGDDSEPVPPCDDDKGMFRLSFQLFKFTNCLDIEMCSPFRSPSPLRIEPERSPTPPPPHGSSKATGGFARGRQSKFNLADAETDIQDNPPLSVQARVFVWFSSTMDVKITDAPQLVVKTSHFAIVSGSLKGVAAKLPLLQSVFIFILLFY